MTSTAFIAIACGVIMSIAIAFPAMAQGKTASSAMDAIARQPDAAGNIRSTLIVSLALMEALAIYGLLIAFMLVSKL